MSIFSQHRIRELSDTQPNVFLQGIEDGRREVVRVSPSGLLNTVHGVWSARLRAFRATEDAVGHIDPLNMSPEQEAHFVAAQVAIDQAIDPESEIAA